MGDRFIGGHECDGMCLCASVFLCYVAEGEERESKIAPTYKLSVTAFRTCLDVERMMP